MIRITHIITSLEEGGAQRSLARLVNASHYGERQLIVSLTTANLYRKEILRSGAKLIELNARGLFDAPWILAKLCFILFREKSNVVQTWLYHADLLGGLAARLLGIERVIWSIRHSNGSISDLGISTWLLVRVNALASYLIPTRIVYVANSAKQYHCRHFFRSDISLVIPNGFSIDEFKSSSPSPRNTKISVVQANRDFLRLCMVARYHPQKDHKMLFESLAILKSYGCPFRLYLAGADICETNALLAQQVRSSSLYNSVELLGTIDSPHALFSQMDVSVLSSCSGEAFPNVLAESMMCGCPCIATDVGDSRDIIGSYGWIVKPRDPIAFANAMYSAWRLTQSSEYYALKIKCAEQISRRFSIRSTLEKYTRLWE